MSLAKKRNDGDDIVISGISGVFPTCQNVKEFEYNLYGKVNMVNDDESRWKHINPDIPRYSGKIPDLGGFDATFFGVHRLQTDNMDPQNRFLIEESFKCVLDAGINPSELRGTDTGVYIGSSVSESENYLYYHQNVPSGFGITGCSKAMFANRISYSFGINGPSILCDSTCSSSLYALSLAFSDFQNGEVDTAIVGGANLCLHPATTLQYNRLGILSPQGFCCPFDSDADGYNRSEAVGCILLQRRSAAKRVYGTLVYCSTNYDGYKAEGMVYPSGYRQEQLLKSVYLDNKFDVNNLGYLEAHCAGVIAGDFEECKAIDNAICKRRNEPLLVGSVKSNCGHTEPAAGIVSLIKVIFAMQNNVIPPNIHYNRPREEIEALQTGRLKVVAEPTQLPKPYVGINSFGFCGANAHTLVKQFDKEKSPAAYTDEEFILPRIVLWSGRTEEFVQLFFDDLEQRPLDPEYLALAQSAQVGGILGMVFRGYSILNSNNGNKENPTTIIKNVQHYDGIKRPIVWVFSGMGSQWVGMGKSLMEIPLTRQSLLRSHNTLKPSGLDLISVLTSDDPHTFDNILNSFVGIAAIQIALVDILRVLNIVPDFIIGHSVGELGCAYADNCMTAEQMILAAYYRGKVSVEGKKVKGSMAAIGLSYKNIKSMLPESIEVACHNSADSCTISGPCEDIEKFVEVLKSKDIFAREVACSNIAYHSRYIAQFGPDLLKYLKHIIPKPIARSNKWISTSVPKSKWLRPESKLSSAEYHTNNLLNSVLFEESSIYIPKNALTIEIAPHALLQSILKNSIPKGVHVGLARRNAKDNALLLLEALGNLYLNGLELNIDKLYPTVEFPVSRGTPSLSHLVRFDHTNPCFVFQYKDNLSEMGIEEHQIKLSDNHQFLGGYKIDGRVLIPATLYLECVWRTFARSNGILNFEKQAVEFENVNIVQRVTPLTKSAPTDIVVTVQKGSGKFEVTESRSLVASGFIREISGTDKPASLKHFQADKKPVTLERTDFYKELRARGYQYNNDFQCVESAESDGSHGKIKWTKNWAVFMDAMLQLSLIGVDTRNLKMPTRFRFLRIYPQHHLSSASTDGSLDAYTNPIHKQIVSGGIEIFDFIANTIQRRQKNSAPILEKYQFVPYFSTAQLSAENAAKIAVQLVVDNSSRTKMQIIDFTTEKSNKNLIFGLMQAVDELPAVNGGFLIHTTTKDTIENNIPGVNYIHDNDEHFETSFGNIIVTTLSDLKHRLKHLDKNGFVFIRDTTCQMVDAQMHIDGFTKICQLNFDDETLMILKQNNEVSRNISYMKISAKENKSQWMQNIKEMRKTSKEIVLVGENEPDSGLLGFVNGLRQETKLNHIRCILIDDVSAPAFAKNVAFYEQQLKQGLAINILKEGKWGNYFHLKLEQRQPVLTRGDYVFGSIMKIGNLSSIKWLQGPCFAESHINVMYSSLNFRDIMLASGRLPIEMLDTKRTEATKILGIEFSGVDKKSKKPVMGMSSMAALSSHIQNDSPFIWHIPKNWSLQEAATVPVAYTTVYYAFFTIVDIRKGSTILIHSGCSGIGIAAIRIALAYGLEVFTTVSTPEKKEFLLNQFPALKENHIGNSRDTSFEDMVIEQTNGSGVDFVINSLSEDKLITSVRCLRPRGHFLEIGKFDIVQNNNLGLGVFLSEISFHAVLADSLVTADIKLVNTIKEHINEDIKSGIIKPLPSTVFAANDIEKAFRFFGSSKNIGKVLIQLREDMDSSITLPISVIPRIYFDPSLAYAVLGGLEGLGIELTDWMVLRGARKIVLSSRNGITNNYQKHRIMLWQSYGCEVTISTGDTSTSAGCLELLDAATKLGQVEGVFNISVSVSSSQVLKANALATKHLDELSRKLCPKLKYFVVFSNYSCDQSCADPAELRITNSRVERIIEDRLAHGLPGKAIQWGPIEETTELTENTNKTESGKALRQTISSCLEVLDTILTCSDAIVSSKVIAKNTIKKLENKAVDFVLNTIGIEKTNAISSTTSLIEIGMDSLKGDEIKQALESEYNISLSTAELGNLTLSKLEELSENSVDSNEEKKFFDINYSEILSMFFGNFEIDAIDSPSFVRINDIKVGVPIIIIPGFDGCSSEVWRKLGSNLKAPAYVLRFQQNAAQTIDDMINYAFKEISSLLYDLKSKKFHLIAYSFGAMIAHPTMELLENIELCGKTVFIDGSSNWVESLIESLLTAYTPYELEKKIIAAVLNAACPVIDLKTIERNLKNRYHKTHWMQYVRGIMRKGHHKSDVIHNTMNYIDRLISKIRLLQDPQIYKVFGITEGALLVLKPTKPIVHNLDETFGLFPYSRHEIQTETLEGDHKSILSNPELPDIIHKFFS